LTARGSRGRGRIFALAGSPPPPHAARVPLYAGRPGRMRGAIRRRKGVRRWAAAPAPAAVVAWPGMAGCRGGAEPEGWRRPLIPADSSWTGCEPERCSPERCSRRRFLTGPKPLDRAQRGHQCAGAQSLLDRRAHGKLGALDPHHGMVSATARWRGRKIWNIMMAAFKSVTVTVADSEAGLFQLPGPTDATSLRLACPSGPSQRGAPVLRVSPIVRRATRTDVFLIYILINLI
jgi:hypothetical protein